MDLPKITEKEIIIYNLPENELNLHNDYIKNIINDFISTYNEKRKLRYQLCIKCNRYYPQHSNFFHLQNDRKTFEKTCHDCKCSKDHKRRILNDSVLATRLYEYYGEEGHKWYREHDVVKIYECCIRTHKTIIPEEIVNKEDYLVIIKHLYENKIITEDNLTYELLKTNRLNGIKEMFKLYEIYSYLFGKDFYLYYWKYKHFRFGDIEITYDILNKILINYINEYNIIIEDIYNYDYIKLFQECNIYNFISNNTLDFLVKYYDYKYPGYKFKLRGNNYYKEINNRIFDLKYLIEEDLKIPIEKIPLYLTNTSIARLENKSLYYVLKIYYNYYLFDWINECYPNKFIETDFNVSIIRNEFGSEEEHMIHDILTSKFKNVLYNKRNTVMTVNFNGMIPDWFVFTQIGVWIVEYFGLYVENKNSKMVNDYVERTDNKIDKYDEFKNYKFVYLYPDDLKENMKGVKEKISVIL